MRGHDEQTTHMFSSLSPEQRVPANHPLRAVPPVPIIGETTYPLRLV